MSEPINVAILGGSFNPPHLGHIRTMEIVLEQCPFLHSVWMVPTLNNYGIKDLVGYQHRLIMCKAAVADMPFVHVSNCEERFVSTSTWSLMTSLAYDPDYKHITFYYIIGSDCLNSFDDWVNAKLLVKSVPFIIVPRLRSGQCDRIPNHAKWVYDSRHTLIKSKKGEKHITPDISSTKIRHAFEANLVSQLGIWLHPNVLAYCEHYGLYKKKT